MVKQITVFLENSEGRLSALCRCLGDAGVSMKALNHRRDFRVRLDPHHCGRPSELR